MPPLARQNQREAILERRGLRLGLPQDPLLDGAALRVDRIQLGRDRRREFVLVCFLDIV
jgi:hypothetical protein